MTPGFDHERRTHRERTNADWVAGLQRNDAASLDTQEALRAYVRRGLASALRRRGGVDDATLDDLTQNAMIRVVAKIDTFRGDSRFTTWAMAVAIRSAFTTLRRKYWGDRSLEDLGISADGPSPSAPAPSDPIERGDLLTALRKAIDRDLTPRQRAAVLGELAGMPTTVLAAQLGTSANTLYKLHHDARQRLRTTLDEAGFSESDVRGILQKASNR